MVRAKRKYGSKKFQWGYLHIVDLSRLEQRFGYAANIFSIERQTEPSFPALNRTIEDDSKGYGQEYEGVKYYSDGER